MIKTVLFDLDGTLVDSAIDLGNVLNAIRIQEKMPPLSIETIRPTVSLGASAMIKLAFGLEESDSGFEQMRERFLTYYAGHIATDTRLFEGMESCLREIEESDQLWGIVTNKSTALTELLLKKLNLDKRPACVVCGDTLSERKPHPAPILHACKLTNSEPAQTVYIGDAQRDIEAGKRAGTRTMIALYGYLDEDDDPVSWQADSSTNSPEEINNKISEMCY